MAVEMLIAFGLGAAALVGTHLATRDHNARLSSQLRRVASELELPCSVTDRGGWFNARVGASVGAYTVTCERRMNQRPYELVIDGQGAIPRRLELGAENILTSTLGARDIELGLAAFDAEARVAGDEATAIALLDERTRRLVQRLVCGPDQWSRRTKVSEGRLKKTTSIDDFGQDLRNLLELAQRLSILEQELPGRLERNAAEDRFLSVRLRNLTLLQERFPRSEEAVRASRQALGSPNPNLRLAGARHLGEEGLDVVRELAASADNDDDVRVAAIQHLAAPAFVEQTLSALEALLSSPRPAVQRAAIEGLGRRAPLPRLLELASSDDPRTLEVVAETLRRLDDPAAEPCLLRLLAHDDDRVKRPAVRALEQVGSARAVEPLLELAEAGLLRRGLRSEARRAIASIQARLGDAEAGRLTLARPTEQEGGLSLSDSDEQQGALSLEAETETED